jgi:hypothetical protein
MESELTLKEKDQHLQNVGACVRKEFPELSKKAVLSLCQHTCVNMLPEPSLQ